MFYAMIGDVVGSRELEDRAAVQRRLRDAVQALNGAVAASLAAPLKLTAGDELQALLTDPAAAVDIAVGIADALHPASVVWGLGRGELATELVSDVALLDGPCFHRARSAVEAAAARGAWLRQEGLEAPHGETLTALFDLAWAIRSSWTPTQLRYVRGARDSLQQEVAARFGVSKQAVSKSLDAARFSSVREGEDAARALLRWLGESTQRVPAGVEP
ncbi:MAG: SatD family protein [Longimicrobiales bacterium]